MVLIVKTTVLIFKQLTVAFVVGFDPQYRQINIFLSLGQYNALINSDYIVVILQI